MAYQITRGVRAKPTKAACYGPEGVGKTTFGAAWPGAVFIDVEDGSGPYDVARLPKPTEWLGLLAEIEAAASMDEVGTLVVDTLDAAEALCTKHLLVVKKWASIEDPSFGKGYTALVEEFSKMFAALDKVVESGKNVLLLAHGQVKKFEQPDELGSYDRWELKLQKKCAPLVKEWCDLLLFANFKNDMMKDEQTKKYKATGGKRRMMYASHTAAYDAKNRFGLPDEMPFEFDAISGKLPAYASGGIVDQHTIAQPSSPEDVAATKPADAAPAKDAASDDTRLRAEDKYLKEVASGNLNAKLPEFTEVTEPEIRQLHQLMADYEINEAQLRDAVGSRKNNPYTDETPIGEYSIEFVRNTLLKHWEAIVKTIEERADIYGDDIPF